MQNPVSQEILPLGNIAAAAIFPRIYGRSISTRLPNFLGNLEAIRKYCRSLTLGPSTDLSVLYLRRGIPAKMDVKQYKTLMDYLCTGKFPTDMIKAEKNSLRKKSKKFLVKDGLLYYRRSNVDLQVHVRVNGELVLK